MILTPAQLVQLTERKQRAAQRRELTALRVPYRERTDGSLVVLWKDVEHNSTVLLSKRDPELHL